MTMGTGLDADRQERQRQLQEAALRGSKAAKRALREMGLLYWWRGRRIIG